MLRCLEHETPCSIKHRLCSAYVGVASVFTIPAERYQTSDIGTARFSPDFTSRPGLVRLLAANRCKNPRHLLIQPACFKLSGRADGQFMVIGSANTPCDVDFAAGKDRAIGQHYILRQGRPQLTQDSTVLIWPQTCIQILMHAASWWRTYARRVTV